MFASADAGGTAVADRPETGKPKHKEPPKYNVILLDDDDHTFSYVMEMLQELFKYESGQAYKLTEELVEEGRVIVYTAACHDEAVLKKDQIVSYGRDKRIKACAGAMSVTIESL